MTTEAGREMTVKEAARHLGVSVVTVRRWLDPPDGSPPVVRARREREGPKGRWLVDVSSVPHDLLERTLGWWGRHPTTTRPWQEEVERLRRELEELRLTHARVVAILDRLTQESGAADH